MTGETLEQQRLSSLTVFRPTVQYAHRACLPILVWGVVGHPAYQVHEPVPLHATGDMAQLNNSMSDQVLVSLHTYPQHLVFRPFGITLFPVANFRWTALVRIQTIVIRFHDHIQRCRAPQ